MKARIVIEPGGRVSFFTEEGTFEQGKNALLKAVKLLQAQGITVSSAGEVEQHRHDDVKQENKVSQESR